jgi:phosphatidylglycerophosphate synthase
MRTGPSEGWILAGVLDGSEPYPRLTDNVAGMPYVLRLALDMAVAGVKRIAVLWQHDETLPEAELEKIEKILDDERLASRAAASFVVGFCPGDETDAIMITRADRIYHRDIPKQAVAAWKSSDAPIATVDGAAHDAVLITDRANARKIAGAARSPTGIAGAVAELGAPATAEPPYLAFTTATPDKRALRRAERRMVWSLRKRADGLASSMINRHLSLPMSWLLMRTPVRPNHVTLFCFALAVLGGVVIARGGWSNGVLGMLLVNLGSIIDGVDGELARLKYRFSRLGQWMDTLADDFGNIAYITGIALSMRAAGVDWAVPVAVTALACFAITQTTQYLLISLVYKSGDLAAIPWAFQSHEFLSARPSGAVAWIKATVPKMLKRDFALTMFVAFALIGRLDFILVVFSAGAIAFFFVFWIQFFRNRQSLRTARAA